MKIKYFKNGEKTIAKGISGIVPEGVPVNLFFDAIESSNLSSKEHDMLLSCETFVSTASPCGGDQYDEETGRMVARDKTVIKNCNREHKQLKILEKHLEQQLENIHSRIAQCEKKKANAENRLSSY